MSRFKISFWTKCHGLEFFPSPFPPTTLPHTSLLLSFLLTVLTPPGFYPWSTLLFVSCQVLPKEITAGMVAYRFSVHRQGWKGMSGEGTEERRTNVSGKIWPKLASYALDSQLGFSTNFNTWRLVCAWFLKVFYKIILRTSPILRAKTKGALIKLFFVFL